MARNQLDKIVWIVNTIMDAGAISLKDLNRKWVDEEMDDGNELSRRSFCNWTAKVWDTFGISIVNEGRGSYRYYIENLKSMESGGMQKWLMNTSSVSQTLSNSMQISDRIQLEDIPSGHEHLDTIIKAMKAFHPFCFRHHNYGRDEIKEHTLHPYMLKFWGQRWYVVGKDVGYNQIRTYSLDRLMDLKVMDSNFSIPKAFSPASYFKDEFGVFHDLSHPVETVRIKVKKVQAFYLRGLPLHWSQVETERNEEYSIFEMRFRVEIDFIQKLLSYGADVEVLEPQGLRSEMKRRLTDMLAFYE